MKSMIPPRLILCSVLIFAVSACNRTTPTVETHPVPTAEDIRIGRQAISVNEVSLLARSGLHKEALTSVLKRHIPEAVSAEEELKLRGFAKEELLAALHDPQNILTPAQKDAYDEAKGKQAIQQDQAAHAQAAQANNQRLVASAQNEQAWAANVAEQQEAERRRRLNWEAQRAAEQSKSEQAAREQEQLRSVDERWRRMEAQNQSHRTYGTPPPYRRDRDRRPGGN